MLAFESELIKSSFIFDYYSSDKTNTIKLGVRYVFQSLNKTLTDHDIDKVMSKIINKALTIDSVSLPGLQ